jgi:hypothetical protein
MSGARITKPNTFSNEMTSTPLDDACLKLEVLAERRQLEPQLLKGFSAYYLAKNAIASSYLKKDMSLIRLRRGLFAKNRINNSPIPVSFVNVPGVLPLVPRRNTTKLRETEQQNPNQLRRRFVLIIHTPLKTELQRKHFSRSIERTPIIRIRPGLLLAPQIPSSRYRSYERVLQRPSKFISKLTELGFPVWFVPRLELFHPRASEIIINLVQGTLEQRVRRIIQACAKHYKELKEFSELKKPLIHYQNRLTRIKKRLRYLRWQSRFFNQEFGIDLQTNVNRAISAINRVHQQLKKCDIT